MFKHLISVAAITALTGFGANAYAGDKAVDAAREYRQANELKILGDFRELLSMPNVATNLDDMMLNAEWITGYLAKRGFASDIVTAGGAPYILSELKTPGASKTITIYAHFDGQPVAEDRWASPPFTPTLRTGMVEDNPETIRWDDLKAPLNPNWRIFARSAGDDKAPVIALMAALDGLKAKGISPSVNIQLILDGEEEAGSSSLQKILAKHGDRIRADLMLFCDGPMHQSRMRQLVFGVRGTMTVHLTTYGPLRPLHSGHYGNWAPNPTDIMMKLLVGMKDENGRITVPGYNDNVEPITEAERKAIAAMPRMDEKLKQELALSYTEGDGARLEELVMEPAMVVKGFDGGAVGSNASNTIRPTTRATLNMRMVANQQPERLMGVLGDYFQTQGFHVVAEEPSRETLLAHHKVLKVTGNTAGYPAFKTSVDSKDSKKLVAILDGMNSGDTLLTPTLGGSLPIYLFQEALPGMPIIILPIANHDNNQHGKDENLRLQNLWDAIEVYAAVIAGYGKEQ